MTKLMTKEFKPGQRLQLEYNDAMLLAADVLEDGYIKGTASTPATDLMGHKVLKGAFDKSIRRNGLKGPKGIKLLAQHKSDKPAGLIEKLETVGEDLKIEAQLNLNVSYVKDLYEISKQVGGLSFSVGFELEEFTFVDGDKSKDGEYLVIKQGNLIEVSVVTFPAQPEATMDFIKSHETMSELEKALVAEGLCRSRNEAQKLARYLKANEHLFLGRTTPAVETTSQAAHPLLDVHLLKACTDLASRASRSLR
ncbi:HK97 family phage prohead protease [Bradyrhizobium japonicum]